MREQIRKLRRKGAPASGGNKNGNAGGRVEINEAIGPAYSALEEAKADVVGMFGLDWLIEHGALPREKARGILCFLHRRHFPHGAIRRGRGSRPGGNDGVQLLG